MRRTTASRLGRIVRQALVLAALACASLTGCGEAALPSMGPKRLDPSEGSVKVPYPINFLLPKSVSIHPFTGTRSFDKTGGIKGIDVRIEAKDAYGDANKAFGKFRFELYEFRPQNPDPKGRLVITWEEDLTEPENNLLHWNVHRTYEFKLLWRQPIPVGQKFVLRAVFSSPFTERLIDERVFVSGQ